jgi:hypothetical protein
MLSKARVRICTAECPQDLLQGLHADQSEYSQYGVGFLVVVITRIGGKYCCCTRVTNSQSDALHFSSFLRFLGQGLPPFCG